MAKISRLAGSTSEVWTLFVQDSSSTTGAGLAGLAYNASGLTCYYKRNTAAASVAVTLASITTLGTYVSGGLKEVDATNMPGVYEFHPPNAAIAAGAKAVAFVLKGATNLAPVPIEVELTAVDNQATSYGLSLAKTTNITGFNDIAATAIVSSGAITTSSGAVSSVATVTGSVASVTGSVGSVTGAVGSVAGAVGSVTGNVGGDVAGKVLGGGSGTITGTGVNANIASVDPALNADGTAQAGGSLTITLASSASAVDDAYKGRTIDIVAGTGIGQSRKIAGYVGSTRVATVDLAWVTTPDGTSKYAFGAYVPAATTSLGSTAPAGWINAASVATDAVAKVQAGLATASQIPTGFATIAITAGAFDAAVLANAPSGGGSETDPLSNPVPGTYPPGTLGYIVGNLADQTALGATIAATPVGIKTGGITTSSYATGAAPLTASGITSLSTAVNATKTGVDTINGTGVKLKADGLDLIEVESTTNIPQAISVILAALSGPVSIDDNGDDTYTLTFKAPGTNTTRISMVTTAAGERLTTTVSPPA